MPIQRKSVTDQFIAVGAEAVFGTPPADFNRLVPARNDGGWQPDIQEINTDGFRTGRQAMQPDQTIQVPIGGSGSIESLVAENGMFLLFRDLLDTQAALAAVSDSDGKLLTLSSDSTGPPPSMVRSLSFVAGRSDVDHARRETIYKGCTLTDWSIGAEVGAAVMASLNYDYVSEEDRIGSDLAAYAPYTLGELTKGPYYSWRDVAITVDGDTLRTCMGFELTGDRMLAIDRRYLQGSTNKSQPIRSGPPAYAGTFECHMNSATQALFKKWGKDERTGPIVVTLAGRSNIAADPTSDVVMPFIRFTVNDAKVLGASPEAQLAGLTTQTLAWQAVDTGVTNSVVLKAEIQAAQETIA